MQIHKAKAELENINKQELQVYSNRENVFRFRY